MGRWYTRTVEGPDGKPITKRYMSVTTILGLGLPKPALIQWAANQAAEYGLDNLDVLAKMVERGDRDAAYDAMRYASKRTTKRAGVRGTHIHRAIEAYILGKPYPGVPEAYEPVYRGFLMFLEEHRPKLLATEFTIYSDERGYGGTADAIGVLPELGDKPLLLDWKAKPSIWPEQALQLAAYRKADVIKIQGGKEEPMPETAGAVIVRLDDYDYEVIEVDTSDEVFRTFLYVREVAFWQDGGNKRAISKPSPRPETKIDPAAIDVGEVPPVLRPCPGCGGEVEENVEREGNQPRWKCPEPDCTGGKNSQPWVSWEPNPWKNAPKPVAPKQEDVPKGEPKLEVVK